MTKGTLSPNRIGSEVGAAGGTARGEAFSSPLWRVGWCLVSCPWTYLHFCSCSSAENLQQESFPALVNQDLVLALPALGPSRLRGQWCASHSLKAATLKKKTTPHFPPASSSSLSESETPLRSMKNPLTSHTHTGKPSVITSLSLFFSLCPRFLIWGSCPVSNSSSKTRTGHNEEV